MFDSIRSRHRFFTIAVMMLFVIPTFIATGVYSYNQFLATDTSIAKIGSERISQQDLDLALRERLDRMRQMLGDKFDARLFDTPQARAATLDSLLSERALKLEIQRSRLLVSDHKVQEAIGSTPAFQQAGRFDYDTYKTLLTSRGMSEGSFEADVRGDLARQSLMEAVAESAVLPKSVSDRLWQLQHEKREVRELAFRPDAYLGKVQIGDEAIQADYEKNKSHYMTPETVKAEYVVLRAADLASQVTVSPDDVHAFYDHNLKRWGQPERRRASHILITAGPDGSAPDKAAARKVAESVLAKVRAKPADFASLAKEYSKDPGSAQKGGDLGWFGRGMMVKPFEDAVFSLKDGEISGVVESDFGFHIIRVSGIEAASIKPFAEVKDQIEGELRQQAAEKRYSEIAEQFSNFVYEQADALKPAADKFKLQVHEVDGLTRRGTQSPEAAGVFTPAVIEAVFAPDSLQKRRNTKAIEIGGNALVSVRVLDHHPEAPIPLEVVKPGIKDRLQRAAAAEMATKAGQARLAELQKAPGDDGFDAPRWVGRDDAQQLPPAALTSIMQLAPNHLPAFVGAGSSDGGFLVFHVLSVKPADAPAADAVASASEQWLRQLSSADEASYVQGLRQRFGAKVVRSELAAPANESQ
ncbi:MAG TPA: SurA N-terminal domain-containing protein [Burkholderiaceae bacterium]|nr:SurA N-terminal domain-containing protein [Burkholderiaceae bacterium]